MADAYHDLAPTTRLLESAFILGAVVTVLAFFSSIGQLMLLARDFTDAEADSNDLRETLISGVVIVVALATMLIFSVWIYRAAANVRALGARGVTITPGWAVGWFFVPIANLFMTFRAMREIFMASRYPADWARLPTAPIVGWWWAAFWADQVLGRVAGQLYRHAETTDALRTATIVDMISDLATLGALAVAAGGQSH